VNVVRARESLSAISEDRTNLAVIVGDDDLSVVDRSSSAVALAERFFD
jgi:hypothetical protein